MVRVSDKAKLTASTSKRPQAAVCGKKLVLNSKFKKEGDRLCSQGAKPGVQSHLAPLGAAVLPGDHVARAGQGESIPQAASGLCFASAPAAPARSPRPPCEPVLTARTHNPPPPRKQLACRGRDKDPKPKPSEAKPYKPKFKSKMPKPKP